MSEPTTEYLLAKATLCRDLAIKQMSEGEGEQATRNLMRMVKALGEVGIIIEREDKDMDKCRYCGLRGLVLSTINADYSCEHCGEWQGAVLNSAWAITGYDREGKDNE